MRCTFYKSKIHFLSLLILLQCLQATSSFAGRESYNARVAGTQIQNSTVLSVAEARFNEAQNGAAFTNRKITNRVILAIDHASPAFIASAFTATITCNINYQVYQGSGYVTKSRNNVILIVNYDPANPYTDKAVVDFDGGNKMDITITSAVVNVPQVPVNLVLEGEIEIERYYSFNAAGAVTNLNNRFIDAENHLEVFWDHFQGAEDYDLEWTFVQNRDQNGTIIVPENIPLNPDQFKVNSTRITSAINYYKIPAIYPSGYVLYRVRPVYRNVGDPSQRFAGSWSGTPNYSTIAAFPDKALLSGHQDKMNWQYAAVFAEEGKNKIQVGYFDGTLRNRQALSKLNTDQQAIVLETFYDYQGRPGIISLPVPTGKPDITYYPKFNVNSISETYSKKDFDFDQNCILKAGEMNPSSGASYYYSPSNLNKTGLNAYIPDAKKYPFTQTQYTPDNTGRIRARTGVGPDHQLGTGHETKYYYGTPEQVELDRMFGIDAGDASRYKKNMASDANGQLSISYVNPEGKIIATSLAGDNPPALSALSSNLTSSIQSDLLNTIGGKSNVNLIGPDNISVELSKTLLVNKSATRSFSYQVNPTQFTTSCTVPALSYCYNCVLDLTISMKDECGTEYLPGVTNQMVGIRSAPCATNSPFTKTWQTPTLATGNYQLAKNLRINKPALEFYVADYVKNNKCLLTVLDFITDQYAKIDTTCLTTCESCRTRLGVYTDWNTNPYNKDRNPSCDPCLAQATYNQLLKDCDKYCDLSNICDDKLQMLKIDVSPMGQYAEFMTNMENVVAAINAPNSGDLEHQDFGAGTGNIDPTQFKLSILNDNNSLPKRASYVAAFGSSWAPNWRHPYFHYLENETTQQVSYITVFKNPNGTGFLPAVMSGVTPTANSDGSFSIFPEQLANASDFILKWKESWASSLVQYHPEYVYWEFCNNNSQSESFDKKWLSTMTLDDAVANNYLDRTTYRPNPLSAGAKDPFFSNSSDPGFIGMQNKMNSCENNYSMWQLANLTANCPKYNPQTGACASPACLDTKIDATNEWNYFKSFYTSAKQNIYEIKMANYAIQNGGYNACIGNDHFNPWDYGFVSFSLFFSSPYFNPQQPCGSSTRSLYAKKVKNFPGGSDVSQVVNCASRTAGNYNICQPQSITQQQVDQIKVETQKAQYRECGRCLLAADLGSFLQEVATYKELLTNTFSLSCYPQATKYDKFFSSLENSIPGTGTISWNFVSNTIYAATNSRKLDVSIKRDDNSGNCTLSLLFPANSTFNFSDIKTLCCLYYKSSNTLLPKTGTNNFTISATVARAGFPDEMVILEGVTSCIDVGNCVIPLDCSKSAQGIELQTLLNMVASSAPNGVAATTFALGTPPYSDELRTMFGKDASYNLAAATWTTSVSANQRLEITIALSSMEKYNLELYFSGSALNYQNILSFFSIQPDPSGTPNQFLITAAVKDNPADPNTTTSCVKMIGYSTSISAGGCTEVIRKTAGK